MRRFFLFLAGHPGLRRRMETWPLARKFTRRFIAGDTLEDALAVAASLQAQGIETTLDHLGESVTSAEEARRSCDACIDAVGAIEARKLPATVSIKLTQFGLDLGPDRGIAVCFENVHRLLDRARPGQIRVEIDMESSAYTERTLHVVSRLAQEGACVRAVIQAYLHRSATDIENLNRDRVPVRLVKGAYEEPPVLTFASKRDVDRNYKALMKVLLDHGTYPAIATHDQIILAEALRYVKERGIPAGRFEFQMLYGIRRDLQKQIVAQGYRLRLYVPYGTEWYPYFMRRLAERPANVFFVLRNLFR
jgi:proline dehydrogenase